MELELILTEKLSDDFTDCGNLYLRFRRDNGRKVKFRGDVEDGHRNVTTLRNQPLPVRIIIDSPEDCETDSKGVLVIPPGVWIQIDPLQFN